MRLLEIERIIEEQGIIPGDSVEMDINCHNSTFPDYRFRTLAYIISFNYKNYLEPGEKPDAIPDILFYVDTRKDVPKFERDSNPGDNNCGSPYSAKKDILSLKKLGSGFRKT